GRQAQAVDHVDRVELYGLPKTARLPLLEKGNGHGSRGKGDDSFWRLGADYGKVGLKIGLAELEKNRIDDFAVVGLGESPHQVFASLIIGSNEQDGFDAVVFHDLSRRVAELIVLPT